MHRNDTIRMIKRNANVVGLMFIAVILAVS
jgi:hypothetical protein